MSSATSTERVQLKPDATSGKPEGSDSGLEPWQFFVLAALGCATAAMFASRGQGLTAVVLLTVLMAATAIVGLGVLRMLKPLVSPEEDRTAMVGHRTRAALEREKTLTLRAIKELEFDRAMGKWSDADWQEMSGRLRARAAGLMRQLDAGEGYRSRIERDLSTRLGQAATAPTESSSARDTGRTDASDLPACTSCATVNDADARFCKSCGQKL